MKVKLNHSSAASSRHPKRLAIFMATCLGGIFALGCGYGGYLYGAKQAPSELLGAWEYELHQQRLEIDSAQKSVDANLDALTQRIGLLQAHVSRIDALGMRLVSMAKLNSTEFDFSTNPGLGGPEEALANEDVSSLEINRVMEKLELALLEREQQLDILSERILNDSVDQQVRPSGFPVPSGWVSSTYGYRADPFNGRRQFHKGVDIAAPNGSAITSMAGGIVKRAESHPQYGLMVEVDHGNGYATLYGHCSTVLVSAGDVVQKGTPLATVGSTGRSTGPHLHFEVLKEGRNINPATLMEKRG